MEEESVHEDELVWGYVLRQYLQGDRSDLDFHGESLFVKTESAVYRIKQTNFKEPFPDDLWPALWVSRGAWFTADRRLIYSYFVMKSRVALFEQETGRGPIAPSPADIRDATRFLKQEFVRAPGDVALRHLFEYKDDTCPREIQNVRCVNTDTLIFIHTAAKIVAIHRSFDVETRADAQKQETPSSVTRASVTDGSVMPLISPHMEWDRIRELIDRSIQEKFSRQPQSNYRRAEGDSPESLQKEPIVQLDAEQKFRKAAAKTSFGELGFYPSTEEIVAAKKRLALDPDFFNVAVVGRSGSGSSSIVRALAGDPSEGDLSSPPHTRHMSRHIGSNWFRGGKVMFFDFPGVGERQYFQAWDLCGFDLIILVVGDENLLDTDLNILRHCRNLGIPSLLARTKCDVQLQSIHYALAKGIEESVKYGCHHHEDLDKQFRRAREDFRRETKKSLLTQLKNERLERHAKVYLVNANSLRRFASGRGDEFVIDEARLEQRLGSTSDCESSEGNSFE
eukprot:Gregarina_sp_Pseudo_9__526@NODE_1339_length_1674_cov_19_217125_g1251_i0_p1_GENE_NODE_1339_length_1674_cov_19_217125_g1251_i0NODE_1339_length_1674_cov_19_217125_g1251_i0_p1_ORF_typecomplete_len530_score60_77IIGP/PF05049_13/1_6e22MMR_HSR1/PF01926_23/1e05FeoB_N/PF02421_18/1_9e05RsgA_GTPase/PF03193_16/0_015RsgA_GTPase/PF03193_16/8_2e02ABC_tran/PF00005_27/0_043GTP_EFTU/PF00009_27/0_074AIG1/PF04548_16/0_13_NODE_1339_length_1674_cov_19_217125_g1251_i0841607